MHDRILLFPGQAVKEREVSGDMVALRREVLPAKAVKVRKGRRFHFQRQDQRRPLGRWLHVLV